MIGTAVDPGSRHAGVVICDGARVLEAHTVKVDPRNIEVAAAEILALVRGERVVIERAAAFWSAPGATAQKNAAMGEAYAVTRELAGRIEKGVAQGVQVLTVPQQTWAHRIVLKCQGGVPDGLIMPALAELLEPGVTLADAHQRDAAGAWMWSILPRIKRERPTPGPPRPRRVFASYADKVAYRRASKIAAAQVNNARLLEAARAKRIALGCICGIRGGRHKRACPMHKAPFYYDRLSR